MTITHPHQNPNGQRIKAGGMTLVHCKPDCEAEFRSASHESVILAQLEHARWHVIERGSGKAKTFTYRCPAHPIIEYSRVTGDPLPAVKTDKKIKSRTA